MGAADATELLVWGALAHFLVDWLLQSEWIVRHKSDLRHPAGYIHAGTHGVALLLVFPPMAAATLAVAHLIIDTRMPLSWWAKVMSQPSQGEVAFTVHVFRDQAPVNSESLRSVLEQRQSGVPQQTPTPN